MDTHGWPPTKQNQWCNKISEESECLLSMKHLHSSLSSDTVNISPCLALSPISPHLSRQIITTFLGLHKDDGFVLLFRHNLLHQLQKSVERERQRQKDCQDTWSSVSTVSKDEFVSCCCCQKYIVTLAFLTCGPFRSPCRHQQSAGCCGWH